MGIIFQVARELVAENLLFADALLFAIDGGTGAIKMFPAHKTLLAPVLEERLRDLEKVDANGPANV